MFRYDERVKNLEELHGCNLSDDRKLGIAFEEQDYGKFEELLKAGANPDIIFQTAKRKGGWHLSICQCDMLKLIGKYQ